MCVKAKYPVKYVSVRLFLSFVLFLLGDIEFLTVVSLDDALRKVPVPPMEVVLERKEDLEIEELSIESGDSLAGSLSNSQMTSVDGKNAFWK